MRSDHELLNEYAWKGDQEAFNEVVRRHINLVYSTALRQIHDPQAAEDITQTVFVNLTRKAKTISASVVLSGWLYRDTRYTVLEFLRKERRRKAREFEAMAMNTPLPQSQESWEEIHPLLDDALCDLKTKDRDALLLRYFQQRSIRQVGEALGLGEEAARKRIARALDRLRDSLARRGVTASATALSLTITTNALQAAPAHLIGAVFQSAAVTGISTLGATTLLHSIQNILMTKLKATVLTTVIAASLVMPIVIYRQGGRKLDQQRRALAEQGIELSQLRDENEKLSNLVVSLNHSDSQARDQLSELLRLRSEVGMLRQQVKNSRPLKPEKPSVRRTAQTATQEADAAERQRAIVLASEQTRAMSGLKTLDPATTLSDDEANDPNAAAITSEQVQSLRFVDGKWMDSNQPLARLQGDTNTALRVSKPTNSISAAESQVHYQTFPADQ